MKKLILILGANGVGKSTTSKILLDKLLKCAYIDADWCRAINPFPFTESTKETVINNVYCMFRNYFLCRGIENVIFPYSFHGERKEIFEQVLEKLRQDSIEFDLCPIILKCSEEENMSRAQKDKRDANRVERGMKNTFSFYDDYIYPRIVSTQLSPDEVAEKIIEILF